MIVYLALLATFFGLKIWVYYHLSRIYKTTSIIALFLYRYNIQSHKPSAKGNNKQDYQF